MQAHRPRRARFATTFGKVKRPDAGATDVKRAFLHGTLDFTFPPASQKKHSVFTVNFLTPTPRVGVSYRCHFTITSQSDPSLIDTVVAKMSTY